MNVHQLATKYHLDVSLFERLIMGGMKAVRLGVQHRMRAEVARLIVPAVYTQLENHSSVYSHPHVPGMMHDVMIALSSHSFIYFNHKFSSFLRYFSIITLTLREKTEAVFTMSMKLPWLFNWLSIWCENNKS